VRERLGHPRAVPVFRCSFLSGMPSPKTPGSSTSISSSAGMSTLAFTDGSTARHSQSSRNPFHAGVQLRGFHGSHLLRPARLLAPLHGSDQFPSQRGLLLPGFQRDRPVAGYDYSIDWTPMLAGLSPARMTARLAARPIPVLDKVQPSTFQKARWARARALHHDVEDGRIPKD